MSVGPEVLTVPDHLCGDRRDNGYDHRLHNYPTKGVVSVHTFLVTTLFTTLMTSKEGKMGP